MTAPAPTASPLFLTEPEIRRGIELMHFGQAQMARAIEPALAARGLGRAHYRALYFIARRPDVTMTELMRTLAVTKQALARVVTDLTARGLVEVRGGADDRRQRLLRPTAAGRAMEVELFEATRARLGAAYAAAGQGAVGGFWAVLEGLLPDAERARPATRR